MHGTIPPLTHYASMAWRSVKKVNYYELDEEDSIPDRDKYFSCASLMRDV
jgi:hypothetical protein